MNLEAIALAALIVGVTVIFARSVEWRVDGREDPN